MFEVFFVNVVCRMEFLCCCFYDVLIVIDDLFFFYKMMCCDVYEKVMVFYFEFDEVIFWNVEGQICEGCIVNVVVEW